MDKFLADILTALIAIGLFVYLMFFASCTMYVTEVDDAEYCFADYYCTYWDGSLYRTGYLCEDELDRYVIQSCRY